MSRPLSKTKERFCRECGQPFTVNDIIEFYECDYWVETLVEMPECPECFENDADENEFFDELFCDKTED